jgi:pyruvate,water dikinase
MGVGLLRLEFLIGSEIGIHPLALLKFPELKNPADVAEIRNRSRAFSSPREMFVRKLSEGIATLCGAFFPREVVVRFSDFKSNEYAGLIGGQEFEPIEENPRLGLRGAARYSHPLYREGFLLECESVRRVRERFGLKNLSVMIPFVRTLEDADRALAVMKSAGLERGRDGLRVLMMCEVPSNVVLMREFCTRFDGISIGSNDLTQLILGVDRDSSSVAPLFDERNSAVRTLVALAIREARESGVSTALCGQAPSDFPDFACFLVDQGIDSISLSPDALLKIATVVVEHEKRSAPHAIRPQENRPRHRPF